MPRTFKLTQERRAKLLDIVAANRALDANSARIFTLIERFHSVSTHHPNQVFAEFSDYEIDEIGDFLHYIQVYSGYDEDYALNEIGRELEAYVEQFSHF